MTIEQLIWRSSDADLVRDRDRYREAIEANQMPDMLPHWNQAVALIEHELEQRELLAQVTTNWQPPMILTDKPF